MHRQYNNLEFRLQICPNGLLRFRSSSYQAYPRNFGTYFSQRNDPCLAPYWSAVDLDSFRTGQSRVTVSVYSDPRRDFDGVFSKASDYGRKILGKRYDTFWAVVFTWYDLRPDQPGTFGGVSKQAFLN